MAIVWAVTGAQFTADSARAETFKSTAGARGVTLPEDLKVTAAPTPGASVRVAPGGATLPAGYPSAPGQSYGTYQSTTETVPVAATGSGGAVTKYLIQRITDPQFEGQAPANPLTAAYDSFVFVSTLTGLNYPYVPLAKIVQPANTATITNAMITDMRKLARPRKDRICYFASGSSTTPDLLQAVAPAEAQWVSLAPQVLVPEWANYIFVFARVHGSVIMNGVTNGLLRMVVGNNQDLISGAVYYDFNTPSTIWDGVRNPTLSVGYDGWIPAAMKGTVQKLRINGNRANANQGYLRADIASQIEWDIQFEERLV